ncbi:MAG: TetR family transcriptional regulator [Rhizomicrobium sp.]
MILTQRWQQRGRVLGQGLSATSLDDLAAATAMNRPSLYAAFGDKRAIYAKALAAYRAASQRSLRSALAPERPLAQAIGEVYRLALASYLPKNRAPRGCFLIGSALAEAVSDPIVRKASPTGSRTSRTLFAARFKHRAPAARLAARGRSGRRPLAKIASAALHSIAIQARAGMPRRALDAIGAAAICPHLPVRAPLRAPRAYSVDSTDLV